MSREQFLLSTGMKESLIIFPPVKQKASEQQGIDRLLEDGERQDEGARVTNGFVSHNQCEASDSHLAVPRG